MKHRVWQPGFKVGNACMMPMSAYLTMATSQYERESAMGISNVEAQIKQMMKEATNHARTK